MSIVLIKQDRLEKLSKQLVLYSALQLVFGIASTVQRISVTQLQDLVQGHGLIGQS